MGTFYGTSIHTMGAVAEVVDRLEEMGYDVHTVTLVLNGQHGELDMTVLADDEHLEPVKATGIAVLTGGIRDLVIEEPPLEDEDEDDWATYRVVIDTMDEQYLYEFAACDEQSAREQGLESAQGDGLDVDKWHTINLEEL